MTNRIPPNRSRMETWPRFVTWLQLAILMALSVLLWIGVGCTAEETAGNTPVEPVVQTSPSDADRPTTTATSPPLASVVP